MLNNLKVSTSVANRCLEVSNIPKVEENDEGICFIELVKLLIGKNTRTESSVILYLLTITDVEAKDIWDDVPNFDSIRDAAIGLNISLVGKIPGKRNISPFTRVDRSRVIRPVVTKEIIKLTLVQAELDTDINAIIAKMLFNVPYVDAVKEIFGEVKTYIRTSRILDESTTSVTVKFDKRFVPADVPDEYVDEIFYPSGEFTFMLYVSEDEVDFMCDPVALRNVLKDEIGYIYDWK